jgi:hypothetical protein
MLNYPMFLAISDDMHWHVFNCYVLMIYKMTMHFRCYCFSALCCSLSCFSLIITLVDLSTPWDPSGHFPRKE